jgi:hypothetical protein
MECWRELRRYNRMNKAILFRKNIQSPSKTQKAPSPGGGGLRRGSDVGRTVSHLPASPRWVEGLKGCVWFCLPFAFCLVLSVDSQAGTGNYYGTATITSPANLGTIDLAFTLDVSGTAIEHGVRIVGYDNERGKWDHRHFDGEELPYRFNDVDALIWDFRSDVA